MQFGLFRRAAGTATVRLTHTPVIVDRANVDAAMALLWSSQKRGITQRDVAAFLHNHAARQIYSGGQSLALPQRGELWQHPQLAEPCCHITAVQRDGRIAVTLRQNHPDLPPEVGGGQNVLVATTGLGGIATGVLMLSQDPKILAAMAQEGLATGDRAAFADPTYLTKDAADVYMRHAAGHVEGRRCRTCPPGRGFAAEAMP